MDNASRTKRRRRETQSRVGNNTPPLGIKGLHLAPYNAAGGRRLYYVYAWRGGPKIGGPFEARPVSLTDELRLAYTAAKEGVRFAPEKAAQKEGPTLGPLLAEWQRDDAFQRLGDGTQAEYARAVKSLLAAEQGFAALPLAALGAPSVRGDFLAWRDSVALRTARTADKNIRAIQSFFAWALDRGKIPGLTTSPLAAVKCQHTSDHSEEIWTAADLALLGEVSQPQLWRAARGAVLTGLSACDLVRLADGNLYPATIEGRRKKSGKPYAIERTPALDAWLVECNAARQEATPEGQAQALTILVNTSGEPWTEDGLATLFKRARAKRPAIKTRRWHDLRGTYATLLMLEHPDWSDDRIALACGWDPKSVATIRRRYVSPKILTLAQFHGLALAGASGVSEAPAKAGEVVSFPAGAVKGAVKGDAEAPAETKKSRKIKA